MNRIGIWAGMLLPAVAAVLLAAAVFQFPGDTVQAFGPSRPIILNEDRLVDELGALPLVAKIGSADWSDGKLALDLKVSGGDIGPGDLYADMGTVIGFAFQHTQNVEQLLLRFIAQDKWQGSSRLLLASRVSRGDGSDLLLEELTELGDRPLNNRLRKAFGISESVFWRNLFTHPL